MSSMIGQQRQQISGSLWRPVRLETRQTDHREATVFRTRAAPQGMCDNLINALKFLASQKKDCDGPVRTMVPCLLEKSRRTTMDGAQAVYCSRHMYGIKDWSSAESNEVPTRW